MDETVQLLELPDAGPAYGWVRHGADGGRTTYLDSASFNLVHVVAVRDGMADTVKATVLFAGTPVLVVHSNGDDYDYESPALTDLAHTSAYTQFLVQIGEAGEHADEWQVDHPDESVWTSEHVGDGHELVAFVGVVARALHAAYPDECGKPTGF